jgi:hypothetical protein
MKRYALFALPLLLIAVLCGGVIRSADPPAAPAPPDQSSGKADTVKDGPRMVNTLWGDVAVCRTNHRRGQPWPVTGVVSTAQLPDPCASSRDGSRPSCLPH